MPDVPFVTPKRARDILRFVEGVALLCKLWRVSLGTCNDYMTVVEEGREYPDGYSWSAALEGFNRSGPEGLTFADWVDDDRPTAPKEPK